MTEKKAVPGEGKFNITKVAMVGANENLPVQDLIDFLRAYPKAEIGIHMSHANATFDTLRHKYICSLLRQIKMAHVDYWAKNVYKIIDTKSVHAPIGNVCLHVDGNYKEPLNSWPYHMAVANDSNRIPLEIVKLAEFCSMENYDVGLQLNFGNIKLQSRDVNFDGTNSYQANLWKAVMPNFKLVLPCNAKTQKYCENFNSVALNHNCYSRAFPRIRWEILHDESCGTGKLTKQYALPVDYKTHQGYAGGFGVDNINTELEKIYSLITQDKATARNKYLEAQSYFWKLEEYERYKLSNLHEYGCSDTNIWVSAQSKLQTDDGKTLDLDKAEQFYKKVMEFVHVLESSCAKSSGHSAR